MLGWIKLAISGGPPSARSPGEPGPLTAVDGYLLPALEGRSPAPADMRNAFEALQYPPDDSGDEGRAALARASVPPQVRPRIDSIPPYYRECFPLLRKACRSFSYEELECAVHFLVAEVQERMASRRYRAPLQSRERDLLVTLVRLRPELWDPHVRSKYLAICRDVNPQDSDFNLKRAVTDIYGGIRDLGCRLYATEYGVLLALARWEQERCASGAPAKIKALDVEQAQQALASWMAELNRRVEFLHSAARRIEADALRARKAADESFVSAQDRNEDYAREHCKEALDALKRILETANGQPVRPTRPHAIPPASDGRGRAEPAWKPAVSLAYPGTGLYKNWLDDAYKIIDRPGTAETWAELAREAVERATKVAGDINAPRRESETLQEALRAMADLGMR